MRQSEGNKTANRLSAIWQVQPRSNQPRSTQPRPILTPPGWIWPVWIGLLSEAIEGPATPALAWLARILSSLLLKTASVLPAGMLLGRATLRLPAGIEYKAVRSARQRYGWVAGPKLPPFSPLREFALSPARTANGNRVENILRNVPAAIEKSAEGSAQRTYGAGNGNRHRRHNRHSEIRGTSETRAGRKNCLSHYTSGGGTRHCEGPTNRLVSFYPARFRGTSRAQEPERKRGYTYQCNQCTGRPHPTCNTGVPHANVPPFVFPIRWATSLLSSPARREDSNL